MRRIAAGLIAAFMLGACLASYGAGLGDPDVVDYVLANPTTGQVALLLNVDAPLSTEDAEGKLNRKIASYVAFVQSGQLYRDYPQVKEPAPIRISIVFEHPVPATALPNLRSVKAHLEQLGYQVQLRAYDAEKRKSVDLEP